MTKRISVFVIALLLSCAHTQAADGGSPAALTLSFIGDYKNWNDYAIATSESGGDDARWKIEKAYDELILKYCRETLKYQPIAFGSRSSHDPEMEKILNVEQGPSEATVYTKHEREVAGTDLSNFYEYRYELEADRWYLVSVAVVIDGERYEGL